MYRSETATYYYFLIINGEAHFIKQADGFSSTEDDLPIYLNELNSNFIMSPNWEAVGLCATMELREDREEVRFYVPAEIIYNHKMMVRSKLIKMAKKKYPKIKFVYGELPNEQFQDLSYYETFQRKPDGKWGQKKVPVERAVVASSDSKGLSLDGYQIRFKGGSPYVLLDPEKDYFTYFTSEKEAEMIKEGGKIPCSGKTVVGSPVWGALPDGAEDTDVALLFKTKSKPLFGFYDGIRFDQDVYVKVLGQQPAEYAANTAAAHPLPDINKIKKWAKKKGFDCSEDAQRLYVLYKGSNLEKQSKLPLGKPGGPCHVLYNIEEAKIPEQIKEELREDIQKGRDLENSEAAMIYNNISINAGGGMVQKVELSKHAQYRMDERSISEDSLTSAFYEFDKWLQHKKRNKHQLDYRVLDKIEKLTKGGKIKFSADKIGLTLVFRMSGPSTAFLISAWWQNKPDPKAPKPGECNYLLNKESNMNNKEQLDKIASHLSNLSDLIPFYKKACGPSCDCGAGGGDEDGGEYELEVEFEKTEHGFKAEFEVEVSGGNWYDGEEGEEDEEEDGLNWYESSLRESSEEGGNWYESDEDEDEEEDVVDSRKKKRRSKGKDYRKKRKYRKKNKQKIRRKQKKRRKRPSNKRKRKRQKKRRKNKPKGRQRKPRKL